MTRAPSAELTPWYPPEVKPVRVGAYLIRSSEVVWYRWWNGKKWGLGGHTPMQAYRMRRSKALNREWRGRRLVQRPAIDMPQARQQIARQKSRQRADRQNPLPLLSSYIARTYRPAQEAA